MNNKDIKMLEEKYGIVTEFVSQSHLQPIADALEAKHFENEDEFYGFIMDELRNMKFGLQPKIRMFVMRNINEIRKSGGKPSDVKAYINELIAKYNSKFRQESVEFVKEQGLSSPTTSAVTVAKTNPQDESIQTVMRAWRITPTPDNIQKVRSLLTQMQRRSDKAPEDYGAPMHEMQ